MSTARARMQALAPLLPFRISGGLSPADHRRLGCYGRQLDATIIAEQYKSLCQGLNTRFEVIKTKAELEFREKLRAETRMKILESFWIGPFCVDFFFPQIVSQRFFGSREVRTQGLIVEVDGGIHSSEPKMKKDQYRLFEFSQERIALCSILNEEMNEKTVRTIFEDLRINICPDSRRRKLLMTRIHVWTLMSHFEEMHLEKFFDLRPDALTDLMRQVRHTSHSVEDLADVHV